MKELTEDEVQVLLEGMRIRGELKIRSEEDLRASCKHLSRDELIDVIVAYWRNKQKQLGDGTH